MIIIILGLLGLALGSFINALVWRIHKQEITKTEKLRSKYSITKGRSVCVNCKRQLVAKDLIPVFSWLALKGKCRYCQKPISTQYPIIELATALLFISSYIFWPENLDTGATVVIFTAWLASLVGLIALLVYDYKYLILPNKIVFSVITMASLGVILESILLESFDPIKTALIGLLIGGGIFYILFQVSSGKWIGGGDVKLGFALGVLVGGPWPALFMIFVASVLGSIYSLPQMIKSRLQTKSKIAFGPFLIIAAILTRLFGDSIIDWYVNLLAL